MRVPERYRTPAALALVAANAVPLLGVVLLRWSLGEVMLLYWMESAVIGLFTVVKMIMTRSLKALVLVPFFCVHFGMFMGVHLVFLVVLFLGGADAPRLVPRVLPGLAALFASHLVSLVANHVRRGERERVGIDTLFAAPYPRIVVMHVTILAGGFLLGFLGSPVYALALLVVLKTAVDLHAHARERERFGGVAA